MGGKRDALDRQRAQYELPGFAAGLVGNDLDCARALLAGSREPAAAAALWHIERALERVGEWQRYCQTVTGYDAGR
jgi:hypothetical protein